MATMYSATRPLMLEVFRQRANVNLNKSLASFARRLLSFAASEQGEVSAVSRRAGGELPPVHGPQCFQMFNWLFAFSYSFWTGFARGVGSLSPSVFSFRMLSLLHARLLSCAASEKVLRGFGSLTTGGRWATASPRTPVFSGVFNHLAVLLSHARSLSFAASEQVWRGFGSFASGGRWAAASPRTPVFSGVFSHLAVLLSYARLLSFAASEQVWRGFGSFASGGRWAATSPRTPVFSGVFSHLVVVLSHARLLASAASEQVWRGFGSFASGGR